MSESKQIRWGAVLSYLSIAISIISGLIYTPWMIKQIGDADYGLFTLANSLITMFLVDFGLGSAVSRYVSKYRAEGRQDKIDSFLGAIYKLYLIIDAVIFVALFVVYFLIDVIYVKLTPDELEKFKVVYIIAASFAVVNFPFVTFNGILSAYEKFIQLKLADVIYRLLQVGFTAVALILGYDLYGLVTVHALVGILMIIYKFFVIKKTIPIKISFGETDRRLYLEIFSFSIWVTISALAQRLIFNVTPSILGIVASTTAIAVFGVVTTIEGYTYIIPGAINGLFMPKVARLYEGENAKTKLDELFINVGRFQYAVNGLIIAGFAVVGKQFINLWMGPGYIEAYYGILLVSVPGLFIYSLQIANTALVIQKKVNLQAIVNLIMGIINITLSFILSAHFGVIGACISIFVAYMIRSIAMNVIYYRVMKFDIPNFIKKCYLRMSLPIILTVALGFGVNHLITSSGWLSFIIKVLIVTAIYGVLLAFVGLTKKDRRIIINKYIRKK